MVADQYRSLAADYHWFFDDVALRLGCDTPGVRAAIAALAPGSRVLDAACGIGVDAAALARRGHVVFAADASAEMAEQARRRLDSIHPASDGGGPAAGSADRVAAAAWTELPARFEPGSFDAVLCVGNSFAHAAGEDEAVAALKAFGSVLAPGGMLVIDSVDWDLAIAAGSRVEVEPTVVERDGTRCVRTYAWHVPATSGAPVVLDITPILLDGDRVTMRSYPVRMHPFTRADVKRRLSRAGFEAIAIDAIPGDDRYTATARRPQLPTSV